MPEKKVIWTETALNCLSEIHHYLNEKSEAAASKQVLRILKWEHQLKEFPDLGQILKLKTLTKGYRFLIEGKFKIIYHIEGHVIYIDLVFDTRQDPEKLKP